MVNKNTSEDKSSELNETSPELEARVDAMMSMDPINPANGIATPVKLEAPIKPIDIFTDAKTAPQVTPEVVEKMTIKAEPVPTPAVKQPAEKPIPPKVPPATNKAEPTTVLNTSMRKLAKLENELEPVSDLTLPSDLLSAPATAESKSTPQLPKKQPVEPLIQGLEVQKPPKIVEIKDPETDKAVDEIIRKEAELVLDSNNSTNTKESMTPEVPIQPAELTAAGVPIEPEKPPKRPKSPKPQKPKKKRKNRRLKRKFLAAWSKLRNNI